jgi:hypothetical protein
MRFFNARIYDLDDDYEAKFTHWGWATGKQLNTGKGKRTITATKRGKSHNYQLNRQKNITKAKGTIRRKIKKFKMDRFLTLTFKDDVTDVKQADYEFRNFMKRLRRRYPEFKYIATREFQENRGVVHYHLAINMYIHYSKIVDLWGNGYISIERRKAGRNKLYGYLCKYLTKHVDDERLQGVHLYLCSHGLNILYEDHLFKDFKEFEAYIIQVYGGFNDKFVHFYEELSLYVVI